MTHPPNPASKENEAPEAAPGRPPHLVAAETNLAMRLVGVEKSYPLPHGRLEVLRGVDCEIAHGTILAILGASGSGKSTLLHLAGGLDHPDQGSVWIAGRDISGLDGEALARFRSMKLGFVFQFHHLLPEFSALENVMMPGRLARRPENEVGQEAEELLVRAGLKDRLQHRPAELSGGEKQRVAVARSLINSPALLLADEPSGNLDPENASILHELLVSLSREKNQTVVVATHSRKLASLASRVVVLEDGILRPSSASEVGSD